MYRLKTEQSFDAAHFLAHYKGKCHNIHGHHWRVEVVVQGEKLQSSRQYDGMLVDFSELKRDLRVATDFFDHTLIVEEGSLSPLLLSMLREEGFAVTETQFRPTAEQFARYFYECMAQKDYHVERCTVWETPVNCAEYCQEKGGA